MLPTAVAWGGFAARKTHLAKKSGSGFVLVILSLFINHGSLLRWPAIRPSARLHPRNRTVVKKEIFCTFVSTTQGNCKRIVLVKFSATGRWGLVSSHIQARSN
jgi:hypothetical protein